MAKGITSKPTEPKMRRRASLDLYEFIALMLWFGFGGAAGFFYLGIWDGIDAVKSENVAIGLMALFIIDTAVVYRFDRVAVERGLNEYRKKYEEYEILRAKWLELQTVILDSDISATQAMISGSQMVVTSTQDVASIEVGNAVSPESL